MAVSDTKAYLYYCELCGNLMLPPRLDAPGEDGPKGHCAKCKAGLAATQPLPVSNVPIATTKSGPLREPKSGRPLLPGARGVHPHGHGVQPAPAQAGIPPMYLIGGGIAAAVLIGLFLMMGGKPKPKDTPTPNVAIVDTPKPPVKDPEVTTSPPILTPPTPPVKPPDTTPKPPDVAVNKPPVNTQPTPPTPPVNNPPPVQPVPPPPTNTEPPKDFAASLEKAVTLAKEMKFTEAENTLNMLSAQGSAFPWWAKVKDDFEKTNKTVRQQHDDFTNDAEDSKQRAGKAEKSSELDDLEKTWAKKLEAMGASLTGAPTTASTSPWILLKPTTVTSSSGSTMNPQADGSVIVNGINPEKDVYVLETPAPLDAVTALRLELMTGDMPYKGPGRANNGNWGLSKFTVSQKPQGAADFQPLTINNITADTGGDLRSMLDNSPESHWSDLPSVGRSHHAIFTLQPVKGLLGGLIRVQLDFTSIYANHGLGHFRISVTGIDNPPTANAGNVADAVRPDASDAVSVKLIRDVLTAITERRGKLAEVQRTAKLAELAPKIEDLEKVMKRAPSSVEAQAKVLDEIIGEAEKDPKLVEQFGERLGALKFDIGAARNGDFGLYRTKLKSLGNLVEGVFDFSKPDQIKPWVYDNPNNAGTYQYDSKKGRITLQVAGDRNWDGDDRRDMPVLKLPLPIAAAQWSIEADMEGAEAGNKNNRPYWGIMVWDGGKNMVYVEVQDNNPGLKLNLGGNTPRRALSLGRPGIIQAAKPAETVKLTLAFAGDTLFGSAAGRGGNAQVMIKEQLNFEPVYAALFVRSYNGGDKASATFSRFAFKGTVDQSKLKPMVDKARVNEAGQNRFEMAMKAGGGSNGNGLKGEYFEGTNFDVLKVTRTDPQVNFDWGDGVVGPLRNDGVSIRWTGKIAAKFSEEYQFFANSDDGVKIWVDGKLLLDEWHNGAMGAELAGGKIPLVAGRPYDIKVEWFEGGGGAGCRIWWASPSTPKEVIPQAHLFSDPVK